MKTDSHTDDQVRTIANLVTRLKEYPQNATIVKFELVGEDKAGNPIKIECP